MRAGAKGEDGQLDAGEGHAEPQTPEPLGPFCRQLGPRVGHAVRQGPPAMQS
jgi:hypothetical protein